MVLTVTWLGAPDSDGGGIGCIAMSFAMCSHVAVISTQDFLQRGQRGKAPDRSKLTRQAPWMV
jgi:hypothetical protein